MEPDGTLVTWPDIAQLHEWQVLLLGNGLSINIWPLFGYGTLFERAFADGVAEVDRPLFAGTTNFETVLGDLGTAIRLSRVVGVDPAEFLVRYRRVQAALGPAVRAVHPDRGQVDSGSLRAIRGEMEQFEWIFTTSYDLLVYWAMRCGPFGSWEPFIDHFKTGGRLAFDPKRADVFDHEIPVYFLHGALHLVVGGDGTVRKLRRTDLADLLDQFGQPIAGDDAARPLLVTEGSAREKLRAIESNTYLSHVLEVFRGVGGELPLVVFGSSLGPQDQHLVDVLNESHERPVAVSMMPGSKRELAGFQADLYSRLDVETLLFYDATTHPLGDPGLRVAAVS